MKRCSKSQNAVSHLALLLAVMMVAAFLTSLINAVITGRGCCNCCRCCECADVAIKHDQGLLDYISFFFLMIEFILCKIFTYFGLLHASVSPGADTGKK